jgi:hypothetical protein
MGLSRDQRGAWTSAGSAQDKRKELITSESVWIPIHSATPKPPRSSVCFDILKKMTTEGEGEE